MNTTTRASAIPEVPTVAKAGRGDAAPEQGLRRGTDLARGEGPPGRAMASTREQFATLVKREHAEYERVVNTSSAKVE